MVIGEVRTWQFPSKSSAGTVYTTVLADDGKLLCNCKGWTTRKGNKVRQCTHTREVAATEGFELEERGEFQYVTGAGGTKHAAIQQSAPKAICPEPMLAQVMEVKLEGRSYDVAFGGGQWVQEVKLDGHRAMVVKEAGSLTAWSRPREGKAALQRPLTDDMVESLLHLPDGVYDGEMTVPGGHAWDVQTIGAQKVLVLFDVLTLKGEDLTQYTYSVRRGALLQQLARMPKAQAAVSTVEAMTPSWDEVQAIWASGGEGVVLKRVLSKYQVGVRSVDWIKVKKLISELMTITGFVAGKLGPYSTVECVGKDGVRTTVKTLDNDTLRAIAKSPEAFVGRGLWIEHQGRTTTGKYRSPMFERFA